MPEQKTEHILGRLEGEGGGSGVPPIEAVLTSIRQLALRIHPSSKQAIKMPAKNEKALIWI